MFKRQSSDLKIIGRFRLSVFHRIFFIIMRLIPIKQAETLLKKICSNKSKYVEYQFYL